MTSDTIAKLEWPQNQREIGSLSLAQFQEWYLSKRPEDMIFLGQTKEFKRFVFYNYTIPTRCLRFYYRIKRLLKRQYV